MSYGLRQPLQWMLVGVSMENEAESIERMSEYIKEELNIKELHTAIGRKAFNEKLRSLRCPV